MGMSDVSLMLRLQIQRLRRSKMAAFKDKIKRRHRDGFWAQGPSPEIKDKPTELAEPPELEDEPIPNPAPRIKWKRCGEKNTPADRLKQVQELVSSGLMTERAARKMIEDVLRQPVATTVEDVESLARSFRTSKYTTDPFIRCKAESNGMGRIRVTGTVGIYFGRDTGEFEEELAEYLAQNLPAGV